MARELQQCRICGHRSFDRVLDLGVQAFTGIFPKTPDEPVPEGPLVLMRCRECELVQIGHHFNPGDLYGHNYGYRSGLNQSMVRHLQGKVEKITRAVNLGAGDFVIDIGANDATTLKAYQVPGLNRIGVDPSAEKFRSFYTDDIQLICDFFPCPRVFDLMKGNRAKVITSIAMFYDLEDPVRFAKDVAGLLHEDGVWVFEQSYLPTMLETLSYDTACHEHTEYYGLKQILNILKKADLKLVDLEFNDVNGGSFSLTAAHLASPRPECRSRIDEVLRKEDVSLSLESWGNFAEKVIAHKQSVRDFFRKMRDDRKRVIGYGASTKGNVLLQYCGISADDLICIAEVNEDKFGAFTPGTLIPIVSEQTARAMKPDCYFVLPWHFRENILQREQTYRAAGGKFMFPLPKLDLV